MLRRFGGGGGGFSPGCGTPSDAVCNAELLKFVGGGGGGKQNGGGKGG